MEDDLIRILEYTGYPVYRQGSLSDTDTYPDNFFTFWNYASPDHSYYDNDSYGTAWGFNVFFYSTDPNNVYAAIRQIRISLKEEGWIVPSLGFDAVSDVETHTGRGIMVEYLDT